jgi:hypothetical protein
MSITVTVTFLAIFVGNHTGQLNAGIIPERGEMRIMLLKRNPDFSGVEVPTQGLVEILDILETPVI